MDYCGVFGSSTSHHTYPPQNQSSFHQFAHTPTYPPPYYHHSPYFPPYYPQHPHQTAIQSSCLQGDSTKLSEQTLDGWPQAYGFHNLDHHSVLLAEAEGSGNSQLSTPPVNEQNSEKQARHSQDNQSFLDMLAQAKAQLETISEKLRHAIVQNSRGTIFDCIDKNAASKPLLAREDINLNCPSHQAVLEPECAVGDAETEDSSHAFVQVFTDTPEQRRYEVEQQESRQAPKSFSVPKFSPDRPTAGIDIEQLLNCPCKASECRTWDEEFQDNQNLLWEKSVCQSATGHSISIFPWDPGACVSTYPSWHPQLLVQQEGTVEHAPLLVHSRPAEIQPCVMQRAPAVTNCQVLDSALDMKFQQVPSVHAPSSIYLWLQSLTARIATEKPLSRVPIPEPTQGQSQVTSVSFVWDPGTMLLFHKSKWWLWHTEDMTNWHTNIKFNGVALWLFHFLPP